VSWAIVDGCISGERRGRLPVAISFEHDHPNVFDANRETGLAALSVHIHMQDITFAFLPNPDTDDTGKAKQSIFMSRLDLLDELEIKVVL
jgi:hypothetical protein